MQNLKKAWRSAKELLKLDMAYLLKGGSWMTLSFVVGTLASVVTMMAFGNLLPRETYGVYTYLLSLGGLLAFPTLSGIGPAVTRAVARGFESVVPYALRMQLRYNLFAVAIIGSVALYYYLKDNYVFAVSLACLAVAYPMAEAFHIYVQVLTGKKRFDILAKITSVITPTGALATVITLLLTDNVLIIIAVFSLMALLPKIIAYKWVANGLDKSVPLPEALNEMRHTAFHITGAGIIGILASYIDKIILFQVAGPAALAVYGFAIAGPERLKSLIKNWTSIATPRLAERTLDEIRSVFYKRLGFALLVGTSIAAIYIIFSPYLFQWLLPRYLDSIIYSQTFALGLILIPAIIYIGNIFYGQNMLRAIYISSTGVQLLRTTLFLILGWRFGIWGLVVASLLTQIVSIVYCIWVWEVESRRLNKLA